MADEPTDVIVPILREIQGEVASVRGDVSDVKNDISTIKEHTGKMDQRLKSVEGYMSGFMHHTQYLETELNEMRGRIEWLEEQMKGKQ